MSLVYQLAHMAEEKCQQQYTYMRTVDIGIRHDDYLAVAELGDIEILSYAAAERLNYRDYRGVGVHLVESTLFDVENLASQRQYRLILESRPSFAEPPAESPSTR